MYEIPEFRVALLAELPICATDWIDYAFKRKAAPGGTAFATKFYTSKIQKLVCINFLTISPLAVWILRR